MRTTVAILLISLAILAVSLPEAEARRGGKRAMMKKVGRNCQQNSCQMCPAKKPLKVSACKTVCKKGEAMHSPKCEACAVENGFGDCYHCMKTCVMAAIQAMQQ